MHLAVLHGHEKCLDVLLAHGAHVDINRKDQKVVCCLAALSFRSPPLTAPQPVFSLSLCFSITCFCFTLFLYLFVFLLSFTHYVLLLSLCFSLSLTLCFCLSRFPSFFSLSLCRDGHRCILLPSRTTCRACAHCSPPMLIRLLPTTMERLLSTLPQTDNSLPFSSASKMPQLKLRSSR